MNWILPVTFAAGAACGAPLGVFFYTRLAARQLRKRIERKIAEATQPQPTGPDPGEAVV